MVQDFPVPRSQLPRVEVTPEDHQVRKTQMERMLNTVIRKYDHFRTKDKGRVDWHRWKSVDFKDGLRLYREREGTKYNDTPAQTTNGFFDDMEDSNRDKVNSMLLVGELQGTVENAVAAGITETNPELALVHTVLYDDVADSMILHTLEGPTPEQPLHYLGYKFFVKKAPVRLVRHRAVLYLEYSGIRRTRLGEDIGFLIMESVDLPGFDMSNRNCVRAVQSMSLLFRQKRKNVLEVFLTGVVKPSGNVIRPISSMVTAQTMFVVSKMSKVLECRQLTKLFLSQREAYQDRHVENKEKDTVCFICNRKRKFFSLSLTDCGICGRMICTRCQTRKHVFISTGILGHLQGLECCKSCVLAASSTQILSNDNPIKVSTHLPKSSRSVRSNSVSRSRSSSQSTTGDLSEVSRSGGRTLSATIDEGLLAFTNTPQSHHNSVDPLTETSDDVTRMKLGGIPCCEDSVLNGTDEELLQPFRIPTRSRQNSVDIPDYHSTRTASYAVDPAAQTPLKLGRAVSTPTPRVTTNQQVYSSGSSGNRAYSFYHLDGTTSAMISARTSRMPPTVWDSAPERTYDYGSQQPMPRSRRGTSQQDLFLTMLELRRLAESTYHTTQQNQMMMQKQYYMAQHKNF